MDYTQISNTEADRLKTYRSELMNATPWTFHNVTPYPINLAYQPLHSDPGVPNTAFSVGALGTVPPYGQATFTEDARKRALSAGGTVEVLDPDLMLGKYILDPQFKLVRLGSAVYDVGGPGENFHNLYADIPGVHLVNHFSFPLDFFYKGNFVATAEPYDGLNYLGGSAATVYFNNSGEGLSYMDILSVNRREGPFLYRVQLDDTKIQNIHLGVFAPVISGPADT